MSFTYSATLATDRDWVRFLVHDTVSTGHLLEDSEIDAALAERPSTAGRKYLTAADLLSVLHTQYMTKGKGIASKKVSRLTVVYGTGGGINIDIAMQNRIKELRALGSYRLRSSPRSLVAL